MSRRREASAHLDAAQRGKTERLSDNFYRSDGLPKPEIHADRDIRFTSAAAHGIGVGCDIRKTGAADETRVLSHNDRKNTFPTDICDRIGNLPVTGGLRILTQTEKSNQKEKRFFHLKPFSFKRYEADACVTLIPEESI